MYIYIYICMCMCLYISRISNIRDRYVCICICVYIYRVDINIGTSATARRLQSGTPTPGLHNKIPA